jgi:hypothetical protein
MNNLLRSLLTWYGLTFQNVKNYNFVKVNSYKSSTDWKKRLSGQTNGKRECQRRIRQMRSIYEKRLSHG